MNYTFKIIDINEDEPLYTKEFETYYIRDYDIEDKLVGRLCCMKNSDVWNNVFDFLLYYPNSEELILSIEHEGEVIVDAVAGGTTVIGFLEKFRNLEYLPIDE